ncbi:MAG TPA: Tad domain-containing protein [Chloroflexota bacterium]
MYCGWHGNSRSAGRAGHWREVGQVFVLAALLMPIFLGMLGLAVDLGVGFASHRIAQNTADAAAFGGTILIIDNDPSCVPGSLTCMSFVSKDIYNSLYDAVLGSDAPNHSSPTIHLYDPSSGGAPTNTLGTIDIAAQFIDATGNPMAASNGSSYIHDDSTPFPSAVGGLRAQVSWPQQTYFGVAVGWKTYTVASTAADVVGQKAPTQVSLAPFGVWWDPPYGPCATRDCPSPMQGQVAGADGPSPVCTIYTGSPNLPCFFYQGSGGAHSHPNLNATPPHNLPVGTKMLIFSNKYASDAGTSIAGTTDPDYQLGANDFKGYFGWTGSQTTCLNSYLGVTGNGNDGNNALAALQGSLTMVGPNEGVATFAVIDLAQKSGAVAVYAYDVVPLVVNLNAVNAAGINGPWYGYVANAYAAGATAACATPPGSSPYFSKPVPLQ